MEPPLKRPRLSLFESSSSSSGTELESARLQNDMLLKSKWELIFDKYSRDFSDIGDEIDVMSGQIVVNRGHLESMETETDPGQFDSKTFLRLISAAQENGDAYSFPGVDGVLPSIETMAEQAVDRLSPSDNEQQISRASPADSTDSRSPSLMRHEEFEGSDSALEPYESDHDSLFAQDEHVRQSSVDSLFDELQSPMSETMRDKSSTLGQDMPDDDRIMAKFGPDLGKEVLNLLEQRQQAHIEPAWRIPIAIEPTVYRHSPKLPEPQVQSNSPDRENGRSIWAVDMNPKPASSVPQVTTISRRRDESEDPLQEDFTQRQTVIDDVYSSDVYVDEQKESEEDEVESTDKKEAASEMVTNLIEGSRSGDCTFCHQYFRDKSGVMAHWDRLLKKVKKLSPDDPHDCDAIREVRSRVTRRVRLRRLTVGDFKTMVEFYEGAGLGFDEIAMLKVLRTRKTGPELQDIYDRHRTPHHLRETPEPERTWPEDEDQAVIELCQNPLATLATVRRGMKSRSELQIGNRLADLWIKGLGSGSSAQTKQPLEPPRIKQEPVDDLFSRS